jgi:hypothetical protein
LSDFVPNESQDQRVPCHHIPITSDGETVDTMERTCNQAELEEALKNWLREAIRRIEQERATKSAPATPPTQPEA